MLFNKLFKKEPKMFNHPFFKLEPNTYPIDTIFELVTQYYILDDQTVARQEKNYEYIFSIIKRQLKDLPITLTISKTEEEYLKSYTLTYFDTQESFILDDRDDEVDLFIKFVANLVPLHAKIQTGMVSLSYIFYDKQLTDLEQVGLNPLNFVLTECMLSDEEALNEEDKLRYVFKYVVDDTHSLRVEAPYRIVRDDVHVLFNSIKEECYLNEEVSFISPDALLRTVANLVKDKDNWPTQERIVRLHPTPSDFTMQMAPNVFLKVLRRNVVLAELDNFKERNRQTT